MSEEIIAGLMPTDEELIEQGYEPEEAAEAKAQHIADGLEDSNIVGE